MAYLKSFTKGGYRMPHETFAEIVKTYLGANLSIGKCTNTDFLAIAEEVRAAGWYIQPLWGTCPVEETIACAIFDCYRLLST